MLNGIEAAKNGMIGSMVLNDVLANNLANINTPGFKQTKVAFKNIQDIAVNNLNNQKNVEDDKAKTGIISLGSSLDATVMDFKQGGIKPTGNPLDVAITGNGFFSVETEGDDVYTRNGSFVLTETGDLVTSDGFKVLGENGPINIPLNNNQISDITINNEGFIAVNGQQIDKLKIVDFENKEYLRGVGNSFYKPDDEAGLKDVENYSVTQGSIETSNANVVETLITSISGMRTYESLSKVVQISNRTLGKTVSDVGRLSI